MSHARTQIRDAAKAALTGLTTTASRVYTYKTSSFKDNQLPGLEITTEDEEIEMADLDSPRELRRVVDIKIDCLAKNNTALSDTLDKMISEVETAIGGGNLGGTVRDLLLTSIETDINGEQDVQVGKATMIFKAIYFTTETTPETIL